MAILMSILNAVSSLGAPVLATIGMVLEFGMRMIPSQKPLSILHGVAAVIRTVGAIAGKVADIMDKVLPQNVVAPAALLAAPAPKA